MRVWSGVQYDFLRVLDCSSSQVCMVGCRWGSLFRVASSWASVAAWNASLASASDCSTSGGGAPCASRQVWSTRSDVIFRRFCCISSISLLKCVRLNLKRLRLVELVGMWSVFGLGIPVYPLQGCHPVWKGVWSKGWCGVASSFVVLALGLGFLFFLFFFFIHL